MCGTMTSSTLIPAAEGTAATQNHHRQPLVDHNRRDAHKRRTRGVTALMYACQQGDVEKVRRLLRTQPFSLTKRDRTGKSPLHYCSNSNHVSASQAADVLVMAAPDLIETPDDEGFTPLHLAVIAGNMPLVTFLLANKADVNAVDNERHTVVHWATVCGETESLRAVLAAGAPVSTPDIHGGYPLHYAAQMCGGIKDSMLGLQVLHTLLSHHDIIPSVEDGDGRQPLLWASSAGSARAVLALVRAGASIESSDKDGLTALHCAASRGHTDCIDTLLSLCGASPDVIDTNGCTALHYAVTLGHADATALLLAHGTNANRQDRKGRTAAHCGCAKGQFETVKMLGNHGANLWLRNARGDLPLHEAAASGRRDLVRWLLEQRPSQVNARNNDGRCPLHLAALNDNADMCKILLDAGAQVNPILRTSKNLFMTPLDCALQRGFRATAKYLQLQGGHPANRLGGIRQSEPDLSSANLHIRDDVTFWGDTSDSERENAQNGDALKRKTHRRKLSSRFNKRRAARQGTEKDEGIQRVTYTKEVEAVNGELKYKSEVSVNGKPTAVSHLGEMSLEQRKLPVDRGGAKGPPSKLPVPEQKQVTVEKKRPKSAKYRKTKDKTTPNESVEKKSDESPKAKAKGAVTPKKTSKEVQSPEKDALKKGIHIPTKITDESKEVFQTKEIMEEVVPKLDLLLPESQTEGKTNVIKQPDQHSTISNTSLEDSEEHKNFVVEAHVHSPPKESQTVEAQPKAVQEVEPQQQILRETVDQASVGEGKTEATDGKESDQIVKVVDTAQTDAPKTEAQEDLIRTSNDQIKSEEVADDNHLKTTRHTVEGLVEKEEPPKQHEPKVAVTEKSPVEAEQSLTKPSPDTVPQETDAQSQPKTSKDLPEDNSNLKDSIELRESTTASTEKSDQTVIPKKIHRLSTQQSMIVNDSSLETGGSQDEITTASSSSDSSTKRREHKSFRVLDEGDSQKPATTSKHKTSSKKARKTLQKSRSRSEEPKASSKIPVSSSSKPSETEASVPSLSDAQEGDVKQTRSESTMSVPMGVSAYSDNERGSGSDFEEPVSSATRKKRLRKRAKDRGAKSAGSDYESSNLIDSGFEPSPRTTRLPKWKNVSNRGVNMTSVTQTIQGNIRRYHLERKIFQHLLDLKRLQIRAGQHNEAMLVKRAIDAYHTSCAATVGAGRYDADDYTFKSFERFLYHSLRKLQRDGTEHLKGLPETPDHSNPLLCTQSTHRCHHATHAYTGIPCAAYLPKMDHHTIPKIGFDCKPAGFLPHINQKKGVTLELCHGSDRQIISLPTDRLDQNKRYYVTFTVKGQENNSSPSEEQNVGGHTHSKSD